MRMKVQRIFTLMVVFFVLSTAAVVASSIWGEYKGYNIARVIVNDQTKEFGDSTFRHLLSMARRCCPFAQ